MKPLERIAQIDTTLQAITAGWPCLQAEINERIAALTESLISENNEETRGRIKALRDLLELPDTLQQEREGIRAELPEPGSAD